MFFVLGVDSRITLCYYASVLVALVHLCDGEVKYLINIELRSRQPIYEQIVSQIKEQVLTGVLRPGDSMPSIRKLSVMAQVNPNTVARAYQELERMGIIETLTGRGTFVCENPELQPDQAVMNKVGAALKLPLVELKLMGLTNDQILGIISSILNDLEGSGQ